MAGDKKMQKVKFFESLVVATFECGGNFNFSYGICECSTQFTWRQTVSVLDIVLIL